MRDALRLFLGQLREPAAVCLEDPVIGKPALVDPGIGAEQEALGVARKQDFPLRRELARRVDDFVILGARSSQYVQVGNAVPPLLGVAIGTEVLRAYRKNTEQALAEARRRKSRTVRKMSRSLFDYDAAVV